MAKEFSILIGGAAGQGSRKAGFVIAQVFSQLGWQVRVMNDYQSLVRGGHNFSLIQVGQEKISYNNQLDYLIVLDQETIDKHQADLKSDGLVFCDDNLKAENCIQLPLNQIIEKTGGQKLSKNIILSVSLFKTLGFDWGSIEKVLKTEFKKSELVLEIAKVAFEQTQASEKIEAQEGNNLLLSGNQATALGACKAGLNFYSAYPMSPATGILHYLASQKDLGVKTVQLENELSVVNAALGAATTGQRAMVATSGGGFDLMTEALSFASLAEIPLVIVDSQRASASTGVPTYTGQADLNIALAGGHGDLVKLVIAPADGQQALVWTNRALNLAWTYQVPVIVLLDKEISEGNYTIASEELENLQKEKALLWSGSDEYLRYDLKNPVSPLAFYGQKDAVIKITSYEHDQKGIASEDSQVIEKMQQKRLAKLEQIKKETQAMDLVHISGEPEAKTAILTWGSSLEVAQVFAQQKGFKFIKPIVLDPFPQEKV